MVFAAAGFTGAALDTILGVSYMEADGPACSIRYGLRSAYADAVGDLTLIGDVWGPSVGLCQVRSLRDPHGGNAADRWRIAELLRIPAFTAQAAWWISKQGTDFTPWTCFRNGSWESQTADYQIRTGYPYASEWSK